MIAERPLLGTGPGTYHLLYGRYLGWPDWDERIHSNSLYVEVAATTGLLGLAAFVGLLITACALQLANLLGRTGGFASATDWSLQAGVLGAVVAYLAHGVVDYFLAFTPTAVLLWVLLGLGVGVALGQRRGRTVDSG